MPFQKKAEGQAFSYPVSAISHPHPHARLQARPHFPFFVLFALLLRSVTFASLSPPRIPHDPSSLLLLADTTNHERAAAATAATTAAVIAMPAVPFLPSAEENST